MFWFLDLRFSLSLCCMSCSDDVLCTEFPISIVPIKFFLESHAPKMSHTINTHKWGREQQWQEVLLLLLLLNWLTLPTTAFCDHFFQSRLSTDSFDGIDCNWLCMYGTPPQLQPHPLNSFVLTEGICTQRSISSPGWTDWGQWGHGLIRTLPPHSYSFTIRACAKEKEKKQTQNET